MRYFVAGMVIFSVLVCVSVFAAEKKGDHIVYGINPVGRAEYDDVGTKVINGRTMRLATFHTVTPGFNDLEKIYSDPTTGLPLRVERYISWVFSKERLIEEYTPEEGSLVVKKFIKDRLVQTYTFKAPGPIHNAILLPFYLRQVGDLSMGWSLEVRMPAVFQIKLVSIDDVTVPAGKFKAYHFTSTPHKFEIWISKDRHRIPLMIKGMSGLGYSLQLRRYEPS